MKKNQKIFEQYFEKGDINALSSLAENINKVNVLAKSQNGKNIAIGTDLGELTV